MSSGLNVLSRLSALEASVAQLLAQPQVQADVLENNVLQVGTDGQISALLTGALLLDEGTATDLQPTNAVAWQNAAGKVMEFVQGAASGPLHQLVVEVAPDIADGSAIILASQPAEAGGASITLEVEDSVNVITVARTLINSDANSSFVQLPASELTQKVLYDHSSPVQYWPGATNEVTVTFEHGQPEPINVSYFAQYIDDQGATNAYIDVIAPALTGCQLRATCTSGNPPNTAAWVFYILCILQY
jgi:hypothetical protein